MSARLAGGSRLAAVLLLAVLAVTGCTTQFLYDRIDWFVVWKVQDYVSLNDAQKQTLKADVQDRLDAMRETELPLLAALLEQLATDVESGQASPELLDARYQEMMTAYDNFMLAIVPLAQRFLGSLDDDQIAELFASLEETNEEMYEEFSGNTPEMREKNRNKSAIKAVQRYTGRLDESQREIIRGGLAGMEDASQQWISNQQAWQRALRELVESRPPEADYQAELTQLMVYPRRLHAPEYRALVDRNRAMANEFMAELLNTLDDRQRAKAARKLRGFAEVLESLASPR